MYFYTCAWNKMVPVEENSNFKGNYNNRENKFVKYKQENQSVYQKKKTVVQK